MVHDPRGDPCGFGRPTGGPRHVAPAEGLLGQPALALRYEVALRCERFGLAERQDKGFPRVREPPLAQRQFSLELERQHFLAPIAVAPREVERLVVVRSCDPELAEPQLEVADGQQGLRCLVRVVEVPKRRQSPGEVLKRPRPLAPLCEKDSQVEAVGCDARGISRLLADRQRALEVILRLSPSRSRCQQQTQVVQGTGDPFPMVDAPEREKGALETLVRSIDLSESGGDRPQRKLEQPDLLVVVPAAERLVGLRAVASREQIVADTLLDHPCSSRDLRRQVGIDTGIDLQTDSCEFSHRLVELAPMPVTFRDPQAHLSSFPAPDRMVSHDGERLLVGLPGQLGSRPPASADPQRQGLWRSRRPQAPPTALPTRSRVAALAMVMCCRRDSPCCLGAYRPMPKSQITTTNQSGDGGNVLS